MTNPEFPNLWTVTMSSYLCYLHLVRVCVYCMHLVIGAGNVRPLVANVDSFAGFAADSLHLMPYTWSIWWCGQCSSHIQEIRPLLPVREGTCWCCPGPTAPKVSQSQQPRRWRRRTLVALVLIVTGPTIDIEWVQCSNAMSTADVLTPCWSYSPKSRVDRHDWRKHASANLRRLSHWLPGTQSKYNLKPLVKKKWINQGATDIVCGCILKDTDQAKDLSWVKSLALRSMAVKTHKNRSRHRKTLQDHQLRPKPQLRQVFWSAPMWAPVFTNLHEWCFQQSRLWSNVSFNQK